MERFPTLKVIAPRYQDDPSALDAAAKADHAHLQRETAAPAAGSRGAGASTASRGAQTGTGERSIGDIIRESLKLTPEQIEQVVDHQRRHGVRFGEAAVQLKFASSDDVLWALSQQFHYPFMPREQRKVLDRELVAARHPFSSRSEVFRSVRSQAIRRMAALGQHAAIAIVSPEPGDGKTYFAANLAVSFSQLRRNTLLIDADLRNPRLHEIFKTSNAAGLTNTLSGRSGQVVRPVEQLPNLYLLPAGTLPPNPLELADGPAFPLLLQRVLERFDHVIVDTPAASHGADAAVIAAHCGAAVAIARQGRSRVSALQDFVTQLRDDSTHVLGMLVTEH